MKAATAVFAAVVHGNHISIHAAREGGDFIFPPPRPVSPISIHAAREGGDPYQVPLLPKRLISIHAAREGGDYVTHKHKKGN